MTSEQILEITEIVAKNYGIEDMNAIEEMSESIEDIVENHYNGPVNDTIIACMVRFIIIGSRAIQNEA